MKDTIGRGIRRMSWFALVIPLLAIGAMAQSQASQPKKAPAMAGCPMCQQMMPGGDLAKLIDQVAKSSAALAKETDPAALKKELAEHDNLVKSLQAKFQEHTQMMQKMMAGGKGSGAAGCPMGNMGNMGNSGKMSPGMKM